MSSAHSDRNLVAGLLALQLDYVSKSDLVEALLAWNDNKSVPIEKVLEARGHIDSETCRLLGSLTDRRMASQSAIKVSPVGRDEWETLQTSLVNAQAIDLTASLQTLMSMDNPPSNSSPASKSTPPSSSSPASSPSPPGDATLEESLTDGENGEHTLVHSKRAHGQHDHAGSAEQAALSQGGRAAIYDIQSLHAQGGLGEVFVAHDRELNRQVALKQIRLENADNQNAKGRFLLEAEVTGRLEHPGVVPVYGLGTYPDGRHFYAMRFIRGTSLKEAIQQFHSRCTNPYAGAVNLELRKLLDRFIDVCQTIEYAHSRGVLHRDIKPDNVMLGPYGETLVVDWGLAKAAGRDENYATMEHAGEVTLRPDSASNSAPTLMGSVIGTPAFMSPEQARGQLNRIGPTSDVFSLGATLYYLLTGKIAAFGEDEHSKSDIESILSRVSRGHVPPPRRFQNKLPRALEAICLKAMKPEPDQRYSSASELGEDLERFLADEPVTAFEEPWFTKAKRWVRRHQALATSLASVVLLATLGLGVFSSILSAKQDELSKANSSLVLAEKQAREAAERAELRRVEAEKAKAETETALLQEEEAKKGIMQFSVFLQEHILATAKPEAFGGLGRNVTVIEALSEAETKVAQVFEDSPSAEVTVRDGLSDTWKTLGFYDRAEANAKRAVELIQSLNTTGDEDLQIQERYASILRALGKFDEAIEIGKHVAEEFERRFGPTADLTLTAKNNLANTYNEAGLNDEARRLMESALSHFDEQQLETNINVFTLQGIYAESLRWGDSKDRAKARSILQRVYDGYLEQLGSTHPHTNYAANNLADFLVEDGDTASALRMMEEVSENLRREFGEDHPDRLLVLTNLGKILCDAGQSEEGLRVLKEAWELSSKRLTADHPNTLNALDIYANQLAETDEIAEAVRLLQQVVDARIRVLGSASSDTLNSMIHLGDLLLQVGESEKAIEWYTRAEEQSKEAPSDAMDRYTQAALSLSWALFSTGKPEEAVERIELLAAEVELKLGPASESTWDVVGKQAQLYMATGQYKDAKSILDRLRSWMSDAGLSASSDEMVQLDRLQAIVLRDDRQFAEAAKYFQNLVEHWEASTGDTPSIAQRMQLRSDLAELATMELQIGEFASAKVHAKRSLNIATELIPDDWRTANAKSVLGAALMHLNETETALPLLLSGHEGVLPVLDFRPDIVEASLDRLIDYYSMSDDSTNVQLWKDKKSELLGDEAVNP